MANGIVVPAAGATWRVVPAATPRVLRPCPRCGGPRPFASSERFRVNASGRKLDVWLIYRCAVCSFTWNLTVVERTTPQDIGAARLEAFLRNDLAVAWSCAFDRTLLRRAGARVELSTPARVERDALPSGRTTLRFALPFPLQLRLDRLLAQELGVPRSRLPGLVEPARTLRRPVFDGQVVELTVPHEAPVRTRPKPE
jgi:hypothetical protein